MPNSEFIQETVSLTDDLAQERVLDLSDMADEPGGALAPGWYSAEIIEGYATRKGTQIATGDIASNNGESRNLRTCYKITPVKGEPRNLQGSLNYRPTDFTPERVAHIKQARVDYKDVKQWPDRDAQRSSLSMGKIGQLGKATKVGVPLNAANQIVASKFVGSKLDVRLAIEDGYNEVKEFAEAGAKTGRRPS